MGVVGRRDSTLTWKPRRLTPLMRKQTSSRDVACFQLPKRQDANAQKTGGTDGGKTQRRERETKTWRKTIIQHTPALDIIKGGIEEEGEKLFHSLLPPISLGGKYGNFLVRQFPLCHVSFCFIVRPFTLDVAVVSIAQSKWWWNIIKISTRRCLLFSTQHDTRKEREQAIHHKKKMQSKRSDKSSLFQFLELPTYGFLCWILMYFTWQALGVAKANNKRLDQEALYTTELDKIINIIDDNVCFLSPSIFPAGF